MTTKKIEQTEVIETEKREMCESCIDDFENDEMDIVYTTPIVLDSEDMLKQSEFLKGINDAMYYSGFISGLVSGGLTVSAAVATMIEIKLMELQKDVSTLTSEASVKISENNSIQIDKSNI